MPTALVVRLVFWLWLGAAFVVGQQLLLQRLPTFAIPLIVIGLSGLLILSYFRLSAVRRWVDSLDLRTLVFFHVSRFVGIYFLVLYNRGALPHDFAVPGGIGDIIVATGALCLVFIPLTELALHRLVRIWNIVGLVDICLVVLTAARLNLENPYQMRAFTYLPLSLLPTFLVPLIISTHVVIFHRLNRPQPSA
jgi:hypothetical protein